MELSNNILKVARISINVSQVKMSQILQISRQQVSNYESGKQSPPVDKVKEIAEAYGISVEELVEHFSKKEND